ncbi:MAG: HAMP domain-containing histidine kinase [Hyphomonadaceae bacterium]|nr:HAMP domain-containing histidine kinase [Hyphomonadaceae bacterium]
MDNSKTRFLTAIGHDMRQPLHALLLYLSALDRRIKDDEAREILGKADRAAQSLASMIESLIDLARLDAGKVEADIETTSLQALFDDLLEHAPNVTAEATPLSVKSDPILLGAILRHLASNAATHGGGRAIVSAAKVDDHVEISVHDEGPGIAPADQERIFEEFVRLDGAKNSGLGIGLTVARKLATVLGHKLGVRSAPDQGATFIIRAQRA